MANFLIVTLEILIGLISAYLIYYVRKKGQNQADKEDLQKLTEIVEEVKMKNSKEIESIRANLSLITDRGKQIFSEEKDSIIVFFAQLNTWIWESLIINYDIYNETNYEQIQVKLNEMRTSFNKTMIAYSKVIIIINDSGLVNIGRDAINKTFELQTIQEKALNKFYINLKISSLLYSELIKTQEYTSEPNDYSQFSSNQERYQQKITELKELKNNYFGKDALSSALEAVNIFQELARKYIRKESPAK